VIYDIVIYKKKQTLFGFNYESTVRILSKYQKQIIILETKFGSTCCNIQVKEEDFENYLK